MSEFVTADQHFGHKKILQHQPNRLDSWGCKTVEEMDELLIDRWNQLVSPKDVVRIVGDFAWRQHTKYLARLKGTKILVSGTHDKMPNISRQQFTQVIGTHKQPGILETMIEGQPVVLSHYPLSTWNASCHGSWHCHGHSHGSMKEEVDYLRCDVGVDVWDGYPVPWSILVKKLSARIPAWHARRELMGKDRTELDERMKQLRESNSLLLCEGHRKEITK